MTTFKSRSLLALEGALAVNDGYALIKQDELTARLVRLSDGRGWTIAPEPEDRWSWTAYVTKTELAMIVGRREWLGKGRDHNTFVRLAIAGLGDPEP